MTFQELQVHQHQAHAIAREALKTIAQASNMSFQVVSKLFRQGDESATYCFWDYIEHYYQINTIVWTSARPAKNSIFIG